MDIDQYHSEKVFKIPHLKISLSLQAFQQATENSYNRKLQPVDWDSKPEGASEVFASI